MERRKSIVEWGTAFFMAALLFIGTGVTEYRSITEIPMAVEYLDTDTQDGSILIEQEETPLASKPVVKVKKSTKKSVKKNKMKTAAKKTTSKTKRSTVKKSNKTEDNAKKVVTDTTVQTTVKTATKKRSKIQTITTTVKTTVKTTTTKKPKTAAATATAVPASKTTSSATAATASTAAKTTSSVSTAAASAASSESTTVIVGSVSSATPQTAAADTSSSSSTTYSAVANAAGSLDIRTLAPLADSNVLAAYIEMGFKTEIRENYAYSGYFSAANRSITLDRKSTAIYHELGHFVAWVAGNADTKAEFTAIYNAEKSKYTGTNAGYLTKSSAEYFAESYRDYVLRKGQLKADRPKTYAYMVNCINKVTMAKAKAIKQAYEKSYWK